MCTLFLQSGFQSTYFFPLRIRTPTTCVCTLFYPARVGLVFSQFFSLRRRTPKKCVCILSLQGWSGFQSIFFTEKKNTKNVCVLYSSSLVFRQLIFFHWEEEPQKGVCVCIILSLQGWPGFQSTWFFFTENKKTKNVCVYFMPPVLAWFSANCFLWEEEHQKRVCTLFLQSGFQATYFFPLRIRTQPRVCVLYPSRVGLVFSQLFSLRRRTPQKCVCILWNVLCIQLAHFLLWISTQNTQEVNNERFLESTRQNNANFRHALHLTKRHTYKQIDWLINWLL